MNSTKTWITHFITAGLLFFVTAPVIAANPYDLVKTYHGSNKSLLYGWSITPVGNDKLLVGSLQDGTAGPNTGAAYLMDANSGNILRTFGNPTPSAYDYFGRSSTVVGNNFLISANFDGHDAGFSSMPGAAHMYDGTTGSLLGTYTPPTPNGYSFGSQVVTVGSNFLIAQDTSGSGSPSSRVTAYLYDSVTGNLVRTINTGGFRSGLSLSNTYVAVSGTNVLIGTPGNNSETGAASLFDTTTGNLIRTFSNPTPTTQDDFGYSVATLPGNRFAISAPWSDQGTTNSGSVYIFDGASGALLKTLLNPNPSVDTRFGISIAAVGDNVLVGAPYDDFGAQNSGSAYLFSSTTGSLLHTFHNPTLQADAWFGQAVSSIGEDFLISAPEDTSVNTYDGAVFRFQAIPEPSSVMIVFLMLTGLIIFCFCGKNYSARQLV